MSLRGLAWLTIAIVAIAAAADAQAPPAADARVAAEDLAEPEMALVPLGEPSPVDEATAALFAEAEARFESDDQPASVPLLDALIARLEPMAAGGHPDDQAKDLLARAYGLRAKARFNLGEPDAVVDEDLDRALHIRPGFDLERDLVSPKLLARFDARRARLVGFISFTLVDPPDLELRVDSALADPLAGPVAALAGMRRVVARRIGYAPLVTEVEVEAGDTSSLEVLLERVAPVLRLHTRPSGALVIIDGVPRGTTGGVAEPGFVAAGAAARFVREEFSSAFEIADLGLGHHELEVRLDDYRIYSASLSMLEPIDYEVPPVVLERERGTLLLRGVPAGATVSIDGQTMTPERRGDQARVEVAPGDHRLLIEEGPAKMFARALRVADRQSVELDVDLKPGLALLGVRGGDREAAAALARRLREALDGGRFTAIEHATDPLLDRLGLSAETLRQPAAEIDWRAAQREIGSAHTGMIYVLAVLSDDLLATRADLLVWAPAPAPSTPDRLTTALDDPRGLDALTSALGRSVALHRPWLGALVIDGAGGRPVVAQVTPDGPAARAGLEPGDVVTNFDGAAASRAQQIRQRAEAAEIGEPLVLGVTRGSSERQVRIALGSSPLVLSDLEGRLRAAVFADFALLEARVEPGDRWLVQLNRAKALLDAGEWVDAARELRSIRAPESATLVGAGTVDYWLGVALRGAGPSYLESARAAFERASAATSARLFHDDGPWLAPRARARLAALAQGTPP